MDDNGSIVLEMCLITPILVCAVFVVMNMLFIAFNHAAASGEAYLVLYNREDTGSMRVVRGIRTVQRKRCPQMYPRP